MEKKRVLLTRLWSSHQPGEIVEEDAPCADSMVLKGYGTIVTRRPPAKPVPEPPAETAASPELGAKGPEVETTDAPPVAETADVTPQRRRKDK